MKGGPAGGSHALQQWQVNTHTNRVIPTTHCGWHQFYLTSSRSMSCVLVLLHSSRGMQSNQQEPWSGQEVVGNGSNQNSSVCLIQLVMVSGLLMQVRSVVVPFLHCIKPVIYLATLDSFWDVAVLLQSQFQKYTWKEVDDLQSLTKHIWWQ